MAGQVLAAVPVALLASGTVSFTSSIYTGSNLKDTATQLPTAIDAATFILDVTQMQSLVASGATGVPTQVQVWIETSPDGGTSWYPAFAFAQVTSSANQQRIDVRTDGIGITEAGAIASLQVGTGVLTSVAVGLSALNGNTVITRDIRVRAKAGGQITSFSCAVWGIFMPAGRHGF